MKIRIRIILFFALLIVAPIASEFFEQVVDPAIQTNLAIEAVNSDANSLRAYRALRGLKTCAGIFAGIALVALIFWPHKAPTKPNTK